jgi:hypothetical protein
MGDAAEKRSGTFSPASPTVRKRYDCSPASEQ